MNTSIFRLRNLAAFLITLSGIGQVAMLWFRELTGAAVIEAVVGITYIIIGIGLQGQSRFTLFVAIVIPAAAAALILKGTPMTELVDLLPEELEALRLADKEGLSQLDAATQMGVSRQTFGNIVNCARSKVATCLVEGCALMLVQY